jgi:two-component system, OmpR family, sensor kinase
MTLRRKLVLTLLALATVGMVALAAVTYLSQRTFLEQRVDDQTAAALPAIGQQLDARGYRFPGQNVDSDDHGPPAGKPDKRAFDLPEGTFGTRIASDGTVLGSVTNAYSATSIAPPKIPAHLRAGEIVTVGAKGDADLRYRLRAEPGPGGQGLTVVAVPLSGVESTLDRLLLVEGLVILGVLTLLGGASWLLVRRELRPLDRIAATADDIASGRLDRRVETAPPQTEVGRLGTALNAMLGRLETAFAEREASEDRLRRFLADASHELRTPLASIRGYAELYRMGAARDPAEAERAMRRIEDEAARMGVLVEDLLTLARLDETTERDPEPVDVAALAEDAVADAGATDPDRPLTLDARDVPLVLGNPDQLRQVLANLLRNAFVHTPAGTPVAVAVRPDGAVVEVVVRDHGPGLPGEDPDALFGRFWRAEGGRERGRDGAGLGLAIVAAIVDAHGGTVAAANAPGGGAAFTVRLPAAALSERSA